MLSVCQPRRVYAFNPGMAEMRAVHLELSRPAVHMLLAQRTRVLGPHWTWNGRSCFFASIQFMCPYYFTLPARCYYWRVDLDLSDLQPVMLPGRGTLLYKIPGEY